MNEGESEREFNAVRSEREECLQWLESILPAEPPATTQPPQAQPTEDSQCCCPFWFHSSKTTVPNHTAPVPNVPVTVQRSLWNSNETVKDWVIRPLIFQEIQVLESVQRCICRDWSQIYLLLPKSLTKKTESFLKERISDCFFAGQVVFTWPCSSSDSNPNLPAVVAPGIHSNTKISDCIISLDAVVYRNGEIVGPVVIGAGAVVMNVSQFGGSTKTTTSSWNPHSLDITVGPETGGGRQLFVTPQDTLVTICPQLWTQPTNNKESSTTRWSVISAGAVVRDTITVEQVYLHPKSVIQGAACIQRCVLFETARIVNGSKVQDSFLQWHVTIEHNSYVTRVLAMEWCHIGPHSKIGDSVLGPDVALGSGEVQSSLVGCNTAAHHQSLLIGMIWCHGRGNVGYGANVGSNHTSRAPDQEAWAAEGIFWGLSCIIVYPVSLLNSPYSIVAAGTKLTPQSIAMPFSLLLTTQQTNAETIVPAWVLASSPYTLARSLLKWTTRRQAQRHFYYTGWHMINRADVLRLVVQARDTLQSILPSDNSSNEWHNTDGTIPGLGKCHLSETSRQKAIRVYTSFLQRCVLHGLLDWIEQALATNKHHDVLEFLWKELKTAKQQPLEAQVVSPVILPWTITPQETWEYQKSLLVNEFLVTSSQESLSSLVQELLQSRLVDLNQAYVTAVYQSKHRDDARGAKIIPCYDSHEECHIQASDDKVVRHVQHEADEIQQRIQTVLANLLAAT